jgi:hypothetical protein
VDPHEIPPGELVTVPLPFPAFLILSVRRAVKVAVTEWFALICTVHVPVPVQAPDQPEKTEPAVACAVRVTEVPDA